jgi:hypothetical protein
MMRSHFDEMEANGAIVKIGESVGFDDGRCENAIAVTKIGELVGCDDGRCENAMMVI